MPRGTRLSLVLVGIVLVATVPASASHSVSHAVAGDDCQLDTTEILTAIDQWASGTVVPGTDSTLSTTQVLSLIDTWATGERIADCPTGDESATTVTVIDVVDGDTVDIQYQNGSEDTVRLLGVDTPEIHVQTDPAEFEGVPETQAGREWLGSWGHNASAYTERVVNQTQVTLVFDNQTDRRGSFDRLLAYVRVNQSYQLNYQLIQGGYARVYTASDFSKESRFLDAEATAQTANRGVWGFTSPSDSSGGTLSVATIHADATGNDHENLNDEYIVFENTADSSLDLTGWSVRDTADHTYTFPTGFTLDAGATVTLHTGSGENTDTDLYWGSGSAVWNNGGDTIIVHNDTGGTVLEHEY